MDRHFCIQQALHTVIRNLCAAAHLLKRELVKCAAKILSVLLLAKVIQISSLNMYCEKETWQI